MADASLDRSLLDASLARPAIDGGELRAPELEAAAPAQPCPPIEVCVDGAPSALYNVCVSGAATSASTQPACLVDPNGRLYLAPLGAGQRVTALGWTQSTDATLQAADRQRCDEARAALAADAAAPSACTGVSL